MLGAVLLGLIVLFVSCSGNDKNDQRGKGASSSTSLPTPAPAKTSASPEPSFLDGVPGTQRSLPALGDLESQDPTDDADSPTTPPATANGQNTNVGAAAGSCADSEFLVAAGVPTTTVKRGAPLEITITVKNTGNRTCSRDVGAGAQELYLEVGAKKYWSSDTCNKDNSADVRQFAPGNTRTTKFTWNGRQSSSCTGTSPSGPAPPPGQFELRARLGTLVSQPVLLTLIS